MKFTSATLVADTIRAGDEVRRIRGVNRAKINDAINGVPPISDAESKKMGMSINVNWGEFSRLFHHGVRQCLSAMFKKNYFFKVELPLCPDDKRADWEAFITNAINRPLKNSLQWFELYRSKFCGLISHGIGPQMWNDRTSWLPKYVALDDLIIPTDTNLSMDNLEWFAVRYQYTEGELSEKVFGKSADPKWNKPAVQAILTEYHDKNYETADYSWMQHPEKMHERIKQDIGYFSSDAVPSIPLYHFLSKDKNKTGDNIWKLRVVPDVEGGARGAQEDKFLYDGGDGAVADNLSELLHILTGDLSSTAPPKYHSIRSLGFLLMEPCFWTNLTRCRVLEHLWENLNAWFRISDPGGKARAQKIDLFNKCILPEGVSVVPQTERHQIQPQLVEMVMAQLRQLMSEASSTYTQQIDSGTQREQTATETMAKVQQVNAMLSGLLGAMFIQEKFAYHEICRRFCIRKSPDEDVRKFQKACQEYGIPSLWLNVEYWDVEPEVPMGAGNPTMENLASQQLLQMRPLYGPEAQQEILHEVTTSVTGDARKSSRWVPLDKPPGISDAQRDATFAFGPLMQGATVQPKEGFSPISQIETLIRMMAEVVQRIQQAGNMATQSEITGLLKVGQYAGILIQQLSSNPQEKQRVKQYHDAMGKLMNFIKGFAQRLMEQRSGEQGKIAPEAIAKTKATMLQAATKSKLTEANAAQKQRHKETAFAAGEQRKNIQTAGDEQRKSVQTVAEVQRRKYAAFNKGDNE